MNAQRPHITVENVGKGLTALLMLSFGLSSSAAFSSEMSSSEFRIPGFGTRNEVTEDTSLLKEFVKKQCSNGAHSSAQEIACLWPALWEQIEADRQSLQARVRVERPASLHVAWARTTSERFNPSIPVVNATYISYLRGLSRLPLISAYLIQEMKTDWAGAMVLRTSGAQPVILRGAQLIPTVDFALLSSVSWDALSWQRNLTRWTENLARVNGTPINTSPRRDLSALLGKILDQDVIYAALYPTLKIGRLDTTFGTQMVQFFRSVMGESEDGYLSGNPAGELLRSAQELRWANSRFFEREFQRSFLTAYQSTLDPVSLRTAISSYSQRAQGGGFHQKGNCEWLNFTLDFMTAQMSPTDLPNNFKTSLIADCRSFGGRRGLNLWQSLGLSLEIEAPFLNRLELPFIRTSSPQVVQVLDQLQSALWLFELESGLGASGFVRDQNRGVRALEKASLIVHVVELVREERRQGEEIEDLRKRLRETDGSRIDVSRVVQQMTELFKEQE